jgi:hypothetical protein
VEEQCMIKALLIAIHYYGGRGQGDENYIERKL